MNILPDVRHKHLIVRAEVKNPPLKNDIEKVEKWILKVIETLKMKLMYGPIAKYCDVEGNRGMTAFAIIETSHIAFHSWDEPETAIFQWDVYTCSELNVEDVLKCLNDWEPVKIEYKFLDREKDIFEIKIN